MQTVAQLQAVIDALHYNFTDFTLEHFTAQLEDRRQRFIFIYAYDFESEVDGAWLPAQTADYLFVRRSSHPIHRKHILLHEMAHMLLNHRTQDLSDVLGAAFTQPLGIESGRGHLRSRHSAAAQPEQEQEAEQFVALLQRAILRADRLAELYGESSSIPYRQPFTRALDYGAK